MKLKFFLESFDLNSMQGLRDRTMFELMYACGLRVSEAVSLRTRDVDFADNILHIHGKGDKERLHLFFTIWPRTFGKLYQRCS